MKYLQSSFTMPQIEPNPEYCCEKCVFGRGEHAAWCRQTWPMIALKHTYSVSAEVSMAAARNELLRVFPAAVITSVELTAHGALVHWQPPARIAGPEL